MPLGCALGVLGATSMSGRGEGGCGRGKEGKVGKEGGLRGRTDVSVMGSGKGRDKWGEEAKD